jgi:hypothetical protein
MPPFSNNVPSKKFYFGTEFSERFALQLGMTYKKRHSHTVKNQDKEKFEEICGMWCQSRHPVSAVISLVQNCFRKSCDRPYTEETIRVGINRSGIISNKKRERSQDVGL